MKCGYAAPGTYGHECGRPAVIAAVKASDLIPAWTSSSLAGAASAAMRRVGTTGACGSSPWSPAGTSLTGGNGER